MLIIMQFDPNYSCRSIVLCRWHSFLGRDHNGTRWCL